MAKATDKKKRKIMMGKKNENLDQRAVELLQLKEFVMKEMHKVYWDSMNQSMNECLDSGEVDRETIEPHPDPMTDQSIEEWGQRNFPAREVEEGEIILSLWDGFVHKAQQVANKCYVQNLRDFEQLERELNPPPPRQPDIEVTPDNIPEELIDHIVEGVMEANNGGIDWEQTFRWTVEDEGAEDGTNHFEIRTNEVTYVIKEENDFKGPLDYGSKTLRKIQTLVRKERE
jgi:hypothetical protein